MNAIAVSGLFWGGVLLCLWALRPASALHRVKLCALTSAQWGITVAVLAAVILLCTLPMSISPKWTNRERTWVDQYERITESFLQGRLDMGYKVSPKLAALKNPYDPRARNQANLKRGVDYHWDHALYKGRYYMYFGVVPVYLAFMPYRLLTGAPLTAYHATQIFVAVIILGFFALFHQLARRFFPGMTWGLYLALSAAFSILSVWYSVAAPALYCTAITAGIAMEVWSFFFFIKGVYLETELMGQARAMFWGALFGALAFGCRPPVALANLLVLPLLAAYLKGRKFDSNTVGTLVLAALPYVVVAILLMLYNYARFDNPFEFGQSYQLTLADMSHSGKVSLAREIQGLKRYFGVAFLEFPILCLVFFLFYPPVFRGLKVKGLLGLTLMLFALPVVVAALNVRWSAIIIERYRMDLYYLMGLLCFFTITAWHENLPERGKAWLGAVIGTWCLLTILNCAFLFLIPYDGNSFGRTPEALREIGRYLTFDVCPDIAPYLRTVQRTLW